MFTRLSQPFFKCAAVALAFAPLTLFAYLGQFTRFISDDYITTYIGSRLGPIGGMIYWYNSWTGSYSSCSHIELDGGARHAGSENHACACSCCVADWFILVGATGIIDPAYSETRRCNFDRCFRVAVGSSCQCILFLAVAVLARRRRRLHARSEFVHDLYGLGGLGCPVSIAGSIVRNSGRGKRRAVLYQRRNS